MKFSHEETNSSCSQEESIESKKPNKRIASEKRKALLEKIFFEGKKIKIAAQELNINYSSAKTILHLYRKKSKKVGSLLTARLPENTRCSFKRATPSMITSVSTSSSSSSSSLFGSSYTCQPKMEVIISQGGRCFSNITMASMLFEIIPVYLKTSSNSEAASTTSSMESSEIFEALPSYEKQAISPSSELDYSQFNALFDLSSDCYSEANFNSMMNMQQQQSSQQHQQQMHY